MNRYRALIILWLLSDSFLFVGCFILSYFLRVGWIFSSDFPFERFLFITILTAPLWLLTLITARTFTLTRNQRSLRTFAYILFSTIVGTAFFSLLYYFSYIAFFSRSLLLIAGCLTLLSAWAWHIIFDALKRHALQIDPPSFPTLFIGLTREVSALIETMIHDHHPLVPVAILEPMGSTVREVHGVPVIGKLDKLEQTLHAKKITHVVQANTLEQSINILSACRQHGITYMLLPSVLGIVERDETIESLQGRPVTTVRSARGTLASFF